VVGHELTHGFDNNGRRFDARREFCVTGGSPRTTRRSRSRAEVLIHEYSSFETAPGLHGNGELTLGENHRRQRRDANRVYDARRLLDQSPGSRRKRRIPLASLQSSASSLHMADRGCQNQRDEAARHRTLTNEHSLSGWRVNGTVQNMPEFQQAFGCHVGQAMVRAPGRAACGEYEANRIRVFAAMIFLATAEVATHPYASDQPITEPKLFQEGVISTRFDEFGLAFTRDGQTLLFNRSVPRSNLYVILTSTFHNGGWSQPEVAPFSGQYWDFRRGVFSRWIEDFLAARTVRCRGTRNKIRISKSGW